VSDRPPVDLTQGAKLIISYRPVSRTGNIINDSDVYSVVIMTWPLPEFTQFTMNADNIMSHNLSQPRIRTTVTARRVIEGGKYAMYSQV